MHLHVCSLTWTVHTLKLCPACPFAFFLFRYCTITSWIHTHRKALRHSPRDWQDTWWTHPQWFIITHFRAMPLQRRKLNKQAMLSVTRWPSSSSRSCLSRTIDCTTDILDLNGGRKKEALNDCLCWACEGPTEGWIAKRETNDFLKQHLCLKINPSDIDGGVALWKGAVWKCVRF